ncbi:prepilin peptidase [Paenarthrobacter sp. Z7-10]|nr:prepilin peptidase [Paenarthrobacter sp. Z7-10]
MAGWWVRRAVGCYRPPATDSAGAAVTVRVPPLVLEFVTAALFLVLAWRFGLSWHLPAYLFFAAIGVELSAIDLRHRLLPNPILLRAVVLGSVLLIAAAAAEGQFASLLRAVLGAVLLFVLYLVLAIINPRGLGMGDVKLAAPLGLFLAFHGWRALAEGAFLGFLIGAAAGLVLLASRRGSRKSAIPFGPSMFVGAIVALLWT